MVSRASSLPKGRCLPGLWLSHSTNAAQNSCQPLDPQILLSPSTSHSLYSSHMGKACPLPGQSHLLPTFLRK